VPRPLKLPIGLSVSTLTTTLRREVLGGELRRAQEGVRDLGDGGFDPLREEIRGYGRNASSHSRTCHELRTTPLSTKGSALANSSAASRLVNTAIAPSS
jgi:hypothetical protein